MKIWKLISLLLLAAFVGACDDDEKLSDDENGGNAGGAGANVEVRFGYEAKTVLKNAGQVLVPVKLAKVVSNAVKVTVDAEKGSADTDAREGIDFNIPEKVVTIPAGDTVAYLTVDLLDNGKADNNRIVKLKINGVYGGKPGTPNSASLHIVSNAFVEFEKTKWETYESANVETSSEEIRNSRFIPLMISGEITETATVVLEVTDSTAVEPTHFTVEKELTVTPGTTKINVEIKPVDDDEANDDRIFILKIKEIRGGNLLVGKTNQYCEVKIISEEIKRSVAFGVKTLSAKDAERSLSLPVFLDKPSVNDVEVTVGASVLSTAVEGEDYVIENKTITIGSSMRGEVVVKILGDNIENADRRLILELKDATEKVALSQTAGTCTVDILNNDWNVNLSNSQVTVEEDMGVYSFKAKFTPVDRERVLKLEYEVGNEAYFSKLPAEITIPANQEEVGVDITVGYTLEWPEATPELKIKFVECDESVYATPVIGTVQAEPCQFRKLTGTWTDTQNQPCTMTIKEWKKELLCSLKYSGFTNTIYYAWDEATKELFYCVGRRVYKDALNFGAELGNNVVLSEHGTQWGNIEKNVKVEYTDSKITVGQIGGVLWGPDGTKRTPKGNAWWIWAGYALNR